MNTKDAEVYRILAELQLLKDEPVPEHFSFKTDPEELYLDQVENLFTNSEEE